MKKNEWVQIIGIGLICFIVVSLVECAGSISAMRHLQPTEVTPKWFYPTLFVVSQVSSFVGWWIGKRS